MHRSKVVFSLLLTVASIIGCGGGDTTPTGAGPVTNGGSIPNVAIGSGQAQLSWQPPTTEADGVTPLNDLSGFKVYYRKGNTGYGAGIDVGTRTAYSVDMAGLDVGTYYFAVTAYDTQGNESVFSEEVAKTF